MRRPAAMPLRALLAAFLLAGLGLWQAWQCSDGMMTSPMTATTVAISMTAEITGVATTHTDPADRATPVATDSETGPGMPGGIAGLCVTVLVSLAAAFSLMRSPLRLLALLRRMIAVLVSPAPVRVAERPALARLCVSLT